MLASVYSIAFAEMTAEQKADLALKRANQASNDAAGAKAVTDEIVQESGGIKVTPLLPKNANRAAIKPPYVAGNMREPKMVSIKGGCFMMGSPSSEPERGDDEKLHEVCVKDFELGKYEVTQAEWQSVIGSNPSHFRGDNLPVENVSWQDIQEYLALLNRQTGKNYRLPSEAEWEYAARAGTISVFYTGVCINTSQANYDSSYYDYNGCGANGGESKKTTLAVGSYPANPWGLHDMAGNVSEWTCSEYDEGYGGGEKLCSNNADAITNRVLRGGSWNSYPQYSRSAYRNGSSSDSRNIDGGFRLSQ